MKSEDRKGELFTKLGIFVKDKLRTFLEREHNVEKKCKFWRVKMFTER